jgi:hypothetical protein
MPFVPPSAFLPCYTASTSQVPWGTLALATSRRPPFCTPPPCKCCSKPRCFGSYHDRSGKERWYSYCGGKTCLSRGVPPCKWCPNPRRSGTYRDGTGNEHWYSYCGGKTCLSKSPTPCLSQSLSLCVFCNKPPELGFYPDSKGNPRRYPCCGGDTCKTTNRFFKWCCSCGRETEHGVKLSSGTGRCLPYCREHF